ncbi:Hypothetical predicted protein [Paramuricea clavata]|uniref:Uncharacterized protein n=1 Tax=Paramuricea clavata TaxID=317549 RepID=A0A7D9HDY6_PARCT|nr:Hypothetical predicted protein [Paramuricea clavata]
MFADATCHLKPAGMFDPILAWLNGQLVKIIPVYGDEKNGEYYGFCDICGAQPYGIEKCDDKLHHVKSLQNEIIALRKKTEVLEKDCEKGITKEGIDKQIQALKDILKITIDAKKL